MSDFAASSRAAVSSALPESAGAVGCAAGAVTGASAGAVAVSPLQAPKAHSEATASASIVGRRMRREKAEGRVTETVGIIGHPCNE